MVVSDRDMRVSSDNGSECLDNNEKVIERILLDN